MQPGYGRGGGSGRSGSSGRSGQGQPMMQQGQPMMQQGQPMMQQGQPMMQQGQPMSQRGQPMQQPGQPMSQRGQPMQQPGQPMMQPGQPMMQPGQPMMQPGQPMMQPGQPMMQPGQPMMQPGQPMMQPGQRMSQRGQPMMQQPGHPMMQHPGQPMMQHPGQPMMMQPGAPGMAPMGGGPGRMNMPFMAAPPPPPNCPPGLEYLSVLDHLFVRQCLEPIEMMTGIETQNAYQIFANGGMIYWAQEHSDFCSRQCCGPSREFSMSVTNQFGMPVMQFYRPYRCDCWLCCCCLQEMIVEAPVGVPVGKVEQMCDPCGADYVCKDAKGVPVLRITGPSSCCRWGRVEFKVFDGSGHPVGKVTKEWGGMFREMFTDADLFGITFPASLPVQAKAVVLGACILIDFMYFEDAPRNN